MAEVMAEGEGLEGWLAVMTARGEASIADFLVVERKFQEGVILIECSFG